MAQAASHFVLSSSWAPSSPCVHLRRAAFACCLLASSLGYILFGPKLEMTSGGSELSFRSIPVSVMSVCQLLEMFLLQSIGI